MEEKIENLIKILNEKANGCSLMRVMMRQPSFKELVSMGDVVIEPIMQKFVSNNASPWMTWLLEKVAKNKPIIPRYSYGNFEKVSNIWKYWYLESKSNKNKQNDQ